MSNCSKHQKAYNDLTSLRSSFLAIYRDKSKRDETLRVKENLKKAADDLNEKFRRPDLSKLKFGMKIFIKQPAGDVYDTSADWDAGVGGYHVDEAWIESEINGVFGSKKKDNQMLQTRDAVRKASFFFNEFTPEEIHVRDGILYAELNS